MQEATDLIRRSLVGKGKADNTVKAYVTDVRMFFEEMDLVEVCLADLEVLAATWMNAKRRIVSPKTLGRRITSMRALAKCLGITVLHEYSAPTPAQANPHPLPGLVRDLEAMIQVARTEEQKALIALTGMCGLRISEARSVGPNDFDLHLMTLLVRGKGDKSRIVPVSRNAWSVMCSRVAEAKLNGETTIIRFTDRHARDVVTRLGARARIQRPVSSHDLRATFATLTYRNSGNDIRVVQELLGHASVTQTQLYVGASLEGMRSAVDFDVDLGEE